VRSATRPSDLAATRRALVADLGLSGAAFSGAYSDAADTWLTGLLGDAPGVALIAVGAYGRRELCPASDLDLVLVHEPKVARNVGEIADRVWYPVWDSGIALDHSVRTVREALAVADRDLKAALGLVDGRVVAGDAELGATLLRRVREEWLDRARRRLVGLDELVEARHRSSGHVAYALEPDLKDGKGGSRDLAALRVLAMVAPVVVLDDRLRPAAATILEARVALQRRAGHTDRLLLEYQDDVAEELGDHDADVLMARVSRAARTIAWQSDEAWRSVRSWLQGPRGRSAATRDVPLGPGLVLRDGEVALVADAELAHDGSLVLRAAGSATYLGAPIARAALDQLTNEPCTVEEPWDDSTREAFVALLGGGHAAIHQFEVLDQHGLLVRYLPEWDLVRSRSQRNAFHRYTVDRHLLETVAQACEFVRRVRRPDLLLMGALLHDLGKGESGDHTDNGIVLAEAVATRMGYQPGDVGAIAGLVRDHLLLASFATGRDLDDPATIDTVVAAVETEEGLDLLAALTEADSLATGETAWTPWKAQLVTQLVARTRASLRAASARPVGDAAPEPLVGRFLAQFDGQLTVEPRESGVTIVAPDAVGLLAIEVAVLGVHAQNVRSARTYTVGGVAVGDFEVEPERGRALDWEQFRDDLSAALGDPEFIRERLQARARRYVNVVRPTAARPAEPRVLVDNELTPGATIVEVRAADGIGVLYRITNAFARLGVRVDRAFVSTRGHEVTDTFYVTGPEGKKIEDADLLERLERAVLSDLDASGFVQSDDQVR
jgi:[protein-PII] uridylyltransferase